MMRNLPYNDATTSERSLSIEYNKRGPVIAITPSIATTIIENLGIRSEIAVAFIFSSAISSILGAAINPRNMRPPIHIAAAVLWKKSSTIALVWLVAAAWAIRLEVTSMASPRISIASVSDLPGLRFFLTIFR